MSYPFTDTERTVLRIAQSNLPDSATPYADMAAQAGCTEEEVLALLSRLRDEGAIRRFGASIKHQKTGWNHNAMVAWKIDPELADACGEAASLHPHISHCYFRPSSAEDWPYTLFTMIHGRSDEECHSVVEQLRRETALSEYAILESLQELKKISMTYF